MALETPQVYGDGANSTIGTQLVTHYYQKKALIDLKKEQYFSQQADVTAMPKNMGKTIKRFHYLPLLDDANINDQGIDANGATTTMEVTISVKGPDASGTAGAGVTLYFVGNHATVEATALAAAKSNVVDWIQSEFPTVYAAMAHASDDADYALAILDGGGADSMYDLGFRFTIETAVNGAGNLYGSSKDVGTIQGKLPALTESGGRVNRVGFKRIELESSITKFGFFDEYTQESLDFDTDAELEMHINREMIFGANEITEDALQIDLLNGAGVIRYAGDATTDATISGADGAVTSVTYEDLMKLAIDLDNNRCPKHTKIITGSRMIDTKVINAARIIYIGSELIPTIEKMTDHFGNQAFVPLAHYAAAGSEINGEIGSIGQFRIVVVPEMMHWAGAGAAEGTNDGYRVTNNAYDVYPMLVIGSESFTTIGFQTSGKSVKFKIYHKKPGEGIANRDDPYGETGFMSIKWYYGSMMLRPERIALVKTVAPW